MNLCQNISVAHQLEITSAHVDPALLDLPWDIPLEEWPDEIIAAYPRGISRHIVRFVRLGQRVLAIKEIGVTVAYREYEVLRELDRLDAPAVKPHAVITGREDANGEELNSVIVTEHLSYSLPYRALFSQYMTPVTANRLVDAISVLLVRLHLLGFYWGDVSLSNTLFRRDAGAFSAYIVDAETGEIHPSLTRGQREYDIDVARVNIIGELMDLQAGQIMPEEFDAIQVGDRLVDRYSTLWSEITSSSVYSNAERWRIEKRIERLNQLGFDVAELSMVTDSSGANVVIRPKIVDAGHYHRRVMRYMGLDVQENQARRIINDLYQYQALTGRNNDDITLVAHDWLMNIFNPTIAAIPIEMRRKLEPAEIFHEVLEHRWFLSQEQQRDVPMEEAVRSYVDRVISQRPDERRIWEPVAGDDQTGSIPMVSS